MISLGGCMISSTAVYFTLNAENLWRCNCDNVDDDCDRDCDNGDDDRDCGNGDDDSDCND